MSRLGRKERRALGVKLHRRMLELLGAWARIGRDSGRPRERVTRDPTRLWCGVRKARDVVIGETVAERRRRRAGLSVVDTYGRPAKL